MSEMVEKAWKWLVEAIRSGAPMIICLMGGLTLAATEKLGWASIFLATIFWVWALDLAATRAAAKAKEETAGRFIKALTSGEDTMVTVEIFHREAALSEERG